MMGNLRSKIVNPSGRIDPNKKEVGKRAHAIFIIKILYFSSFSCYVTVLQFSSVNFVNYTVSVH